MKELPKMAGDPPIRPQRVDSESLLGKAKSLLILHNGREYQLRLTQNGKLILTA
jgi:hemin uptake protein HemP